MLSIILFSEYAYLKQVPDINESSSEESTAYPKNSKYARTKNYTPKPIYRDSYESAESTEKSVRQGNNQATKKPYKNNDEHETLTSFRTDPTVIHEESFGYKIPKIEVSSRNSKVKDSKGKQSSAKKAPTPDSDSRHTKDNAGVQRYSNVKKAPTENSYIHASRGSYKPNASGKGDATSYDSGDSYSYSSRKKLKGNKKAPETTDSQTYPTSEARNVQYITEDNQNFFSPERIRPRRSRSIFRNFIDIY